MRQQGIRTSHVEKRQHYTTDLTRRDLTDIRRHGTLHDTGRKSYDNLYQAISARVPRLRVMGVRIYLATKPLLPIICDYFDNDAGEGEKDDGVQADSTTESVRALEREQLAQVSIWLTQNRGQGPRRKHRLTFLHR